MGLRVIFFSASVRFFVAAAEDPSAKQRNVRLQHAARKLRVCYTHTNARQTVMVCVSRHLIQSHTAKKKNNMPKTTFDLPYFQEKYRFFDFR